MNCENFSTLVINMLVLIELIFIYLLEEESLSLNTYNLYR